MCLLSVAVLASNNERDIADCLQSVDWADERIVVLDTRSQDRTAQIAHDLDVRVVAHPFESFAEQREFGLTLSEGDWLFYIDTDERATPALGAEIRRAMRDASRAGWWVPRRNFIWGREIRHGGWYPDYQLRLLRLGHAHYDLARPVHEIVQLDGSDGHLGEPLLHHNYRTLHEFTSKQRTYVGFEAQILYGNCVRPKAWTYALQPMREFWRRWIVLEGYRDGPHGLLLCALVAYYYGFVVTVRLGRLWRSKGK